MSVINIKMYENTLMAHPTREVKYYGRIGEWLIDNYGTSQPTAFRVQIYKDSVREENEITGNIPELVKYDDGGSYCIVHTAGGMDPFSWAYLIVMVIVLASTVYMMHNLPDIPSIPTAGSRNQSSGNNSLADRSNKLRLGSRVEDAYGENIMIPSLLMPTYHVWAQDKNKIECAYYCLGEGYYDIKADDVKDGDTPINSILDAKVIISKPFSVPTRISNPQLTIGGTNIEQVDIVKRSGVVDGVKLDAPDAIPFSNTGTKGYYFGVDTNGYFVVQKDILEGSGFNSLLTVGEQVYVEVNDTIHEFVSTTPTGVWTLSLNGNFKVKYTDDKFFTLVNIDNSLINAYTPSSSTTNPHPANMNRSVAKVYKTSDPTPNNWTNMKRVRCPFYVKTLFVNVGSSQGLGFITQNGTSEIRVEFFVEVYKEVNGVNQLIATGGANVRGSSQGVPVGRTIYLNVDVPEGTVLNIRMKRMTEFLVLSGGTTLQNITWDDLYIKSDMMGDFSKYIDTYNYTTVYTETTVNASATSVRERELNIKARRKLPLYNYVNNRFSTSLQQNGYCEDESSLSPYPDIPSILGHMAKTASIGKWYGVTNEVKGPVDVYQIYAAVTDIYLYHLNYRTEAVAKNMVSFNYTFDDNNTSFEETIAVVANAIDCGAYRQGGKIRFFPNIPQQYNTIMFNHRNKIGDSSDKITRSFKNGGEYDGVEFVYQDIDTGKAESILLPRGVVAIKRKKMEVAGIRQYAQAWIRANREWNKIKYRRSQIKTEVTHEARALVVGQRVGVMDNTLFKADCGEVVAYYKDQNTFQTFLTLSDAITNTNITNCNIYLKRRNGTVQRVGIRNKVDDYTVELALNVDEPTVTEYSNDGMRTAYTIVDASKETSASWVVSDVEINENSSTLTAYNYTDKYWETDSQTIPNKIDII